MFKSILKMIPPRPVSSRNMMSSSLLAETTQTKTNDAFVELYKIHCDIHNAEGKPLIKSSNYTIMKRVRIGVFLT